MAIFDDQSRRRLMDYLTQTFDPENAGEAEAFARNYLHNGALWDRLADLFPTVSASALRAAMTEAHAEWLRQPRRPH